MKNNKQQYSAPEIKAIKLDAEISLAMESENDLPPIYETSNHFDSDTFMDNSIYKTII
jgi:hypothetical protein